MRPDGMVAAPSTRDTACAAPGAVAPSIVPVGQARNEHAAGVDRYSTLTEIQDYLGSR